MLAAMLLLLPSPQANDKDKHKNNDDINEDGYNRDNNNK